MLIQLPTDHDIIAALANGKHIPEYIHRHSSRIIEVKKCNEVAAGGRCVTFGVRKRNAG